MAFTEITATVMPADAVVFYRGRPGTIGHEMGGTWWCTRCYETRVAEDHVCWDIQRGARRWVVLADHHAEDVDDFGWDDAADSEASDLDDKQGDWVTRVVYEPWAISGDLPGPDEVLRRHPELADDPQWAVFLVGSNDGEIDVEADGLTLAEAEARA